MKIELLGWSCKGIRAADMNIDLQKNDSEVTKLSLILLDNSGGKTTTSELIRDTLSGRSENYNTEQVAHYANESNDNPTGTFQVDVRLDADVYSFINNFNFEDNSIQVTTKGGIAGTKNGWAPPHSALPFFDYGLVSLYIYDGEQTQRLLNKSRRDVETVLDNIYQLTEFDKIKILLDEHLSRQQDLVKAKKTNQNALTSLDNKIKKLNARRIQLEEEFREADREIIDANKKITELDDEKKQTTVDRDKKVTKLNDLESDITELENKNKEISIQILDLYKQPFNISKSIEKEYLTFRENLDDQKLPEASTRAFFEETANESFCICGEKLDERKRNIILEKSKTFMGDQYTEFLNAMKSSVSDSIVTANENHQEQLIKCNKDLESNNNELTEKINDKSQVSAALKASSGRTFKEIDDDISKQQSRLTLANNFKDGYEKLNADVKELTPIENIKSIKDIEKLITKYNDEMELGKNIATLRLKIGKIKDLIDECKEKTKVIIKNKLIENINEELKRTVTQGEPPQIEALEGFIKLKSNKVKEKAVNVGAELAIAYIFLITALKEADQANQFPLFVDSPANSIGSNIRENIAKLVMDKTNQFICLIQLGEREFFVKKLKEHSQGNSKIYTVFRKTQETKHYFEEENEKMKKYDNSAVVTGYDFLENFYIPGTN
jgi:DNA sulfur modification protein DndD